MHHSATVVNRKMSYVLRIQGIDHLINHLISKLLIQKSLFE